MHSLHSYTPLMHSYTPCTAEKTIWIWSDLLKKSLMQNFIFCATMSATLPPHEECSSKYFCVSICKGSKNVFKKKPLTSLHKRF